MQEGPHRRRGRPISGEVVSDARQDYDQTGRPEVSMSMNPTGAHKWQQNDRRQHRHARWPWCSTTTCIPTQWCRAKSRGGNTSISGSFTIEEAQDLANVLKAGKLPAPTRIVEEAVVGPSLGKGSHQPGPVLLAGRPADHHGLHGRCYYGRAGLVADAALLFNMFLILGVLAQFGTALTLPAHRGSDSGHRLARWMPTC
ncbi:MAG: hypothetical protein WKG07_16460 [Hymenobacter sp.]